MKDFQIDLFDANLQGKTFQYSLTDSFFQEIDGLIHRGTLTTECRCLRATSMEFEFHIHSCGTVFAPCDRCLSDVELRIDTTDKLVVKLGEEYGDDGDVLIVPEDEGMVDMSQPIYEFIALALPLRLIHEPGECDETMMRTLESYQSARSSDDNEDADDSSSSDSDAEPAECDERWSALKKLLT